MVPKHGTEAAPMQYGTPGRLVVRARPKAQQVAKTAARQELTEIPLFEALPYGRHRHLTGHHGCRHSRRSSGNFRFSTANRLARHKGTSVGVVSWCLVTEEAGQRLRQSDFRSRKPDQRYGECAWSGVVVPPPCRAWHLVASAAADRFKDCETHVLRFGIVRSRRIGMIA